MTKLEGETIERPVGVSLGSLSKFFPQRQMEMILRATGSEGARRRKLPPLDLVDYLIAHSALSCGWHATTALLQQLRETRAG